MISRAELDELYRADDRLRAEYAEWMAQREAQADRGKRTSARPAARRRGLRRDAPRAQEFSAAVVEKFRALERESIALKAKLDVVLTLIGKSETVSNMAADSVVDLPKNFWKRDAA